MTLTIQGQSARIKKGYVYIGLSKTFKEEHNPYINELKFKLPQNIVAEGVKRLEYCLSLMV